MNRVYRLVWNRSLAAVQVTSELARARGSSSGTSATRTPRRHPLALAIATLALACASAPAWSQTCTPTDPSGCGAAGGVGGRPGRSPTGGSGNGTGGDAIVWNPNTSESPGSTATAGTGGNGANGVFNVGSVNITSSGGAGGLVGATGSAGVVSSVTGSTGGAGQAESGSSVVGGGGGGGGAGVYINDGNSSPIVGTTTTLAGGAGGRGGDATATGSNGNATNGDPGGGGGGGAGAIIASGAGGVSLINNGRMLGGAGGAGGNGGYAGSGGGGGDGLLVLGAGAAVTNNSTGSIIGGLGGNPGIYQDGGNLPGGYGGGGAGVNLVGAGSSLENAGTIIGGNASTISPIPSAQDGTPGVGVRGWGGITVVTDGTIAGGSNGTVQADSVLFSGGGNQLVILSGAIFTGNIQSISGSTNGGDILTLAGAVNGSINAGLIVGFVSNTKIGNSNWTLTGTGNAAIDWTVQQGELTGSSSAFDGNLTFVSNGLGTPSVDFNQATTGSFGGSISGAGALIKDGAGSLTLTGDLSTFSGRFTINQGTVALSNNGNLQSAEISDGGTLDISGTSGSTATIAGISGSGAVTLGSHTLVINNAANDNFSGVIGGNGGVTLNGGTQTFSGSNTYLGGTTINGGTLLVSSDANLGNSSGAVALGGGTLETTATFTTARNFALINSTGGTLQTNANLTISGNITGNGMLTKTGVGTLTLSGVNNYTGGTTISAGTLQGDTTSLQGNILNNAALVFDQTSNGTYSGVISGNGTLTANGTGTLTLDGVNTSSGLTTVASGATLIVGDSSHTTATVGGDVSVNGGTLGGFGTIQGSAILSNSGALTPGNTLTIGTLTIDGDLTVGNGSQLNFDFGAPGPNFATPGQSDHVVVNGNLSIGSSTLNVNNLGSMGPGLYNLFTWGSTLSITGGGFAPPSGMSLQILTVDKQINLIDTQNLTLDEWDANGLAGPGQMGGGSGTWSVSSNTWSDTNGQYVGPMAPQPGFAIFGGTTGTVTVDDTNGQVSVTGMQFVSDSYRLVGNAIDLVGQSGVAPVIRVSSIDTAIIDNVLNGTHGLNKTDGGTLVLTGTNLYTGTTTLSGGYLSVSSDANLGAISNPLDFEGGTLEITGTTFNQTTRTIIWGNTGGGFDIDDAANTFTVAQSLTGSGGLLKSGAGTLVLAGANTYRGGTIIDAGILQGDTSSLQGNITNNATLVFAQTSNGSFSGAMSGSGQLIKSGSGTLILSNTNSYTGGTTINAGTLQGDTNSLQGAITDNAALVFNQTSDGTYSGVISGSGSLTKIGSGTLTLTGANVYRGGTTINAGTLQGDTTSLQGTITDNAALVFNQASDGTYSSVINGSGSVTKAGAGTLTLTGVNVYTGGTMITAGTLQGDTTSLQGNITDNAALVFNQTSDGTYSGAVSGSGNVTKIGSGTLSLTGANAYTDGTTINAGTLQGNTTSLQGNITNNATLVFAQTSNGNFSGTISGGGQLIKNGNGTLILSGTNTYTGGTTISAGTLQGDTHSLQGNITNNAALAFNQTTDGTYNGVITGSGSLIKTGTGMLSLTGANAYTGGTTISAGTLQGDTHSLQGNIANNAALIFNQASDATFSNVISGSGNLTKTGAGILVLDGANTYTGGTTVSAGTLEIGDSNTTNASIQSAVNVQGGGTLRGHGTVVGDVTSDGIVWPGGSMGTLTIQGNYTQNADGTLQLDVTPAQSSMLKVSGNASLAGTLDLIFAPGTYHTSKFSLVQAGSLTGTFGTVNGTVPGPVNSQISYSSTEADLVLTTRAVMPLDSSLFGNLMRSVNITSQQDMGSVLDVALMSRDTQCSADHAPSMQNVTTSCGNGAWAQYTGSTISLDGSNGSNSSTFGLLGGADYAVGDIVHVGLQAGVGQVNGHDKLGGNGRVDDVHGGIYAYANAGPMVVSAVIDTMHNDYHFNRTTGIGTATSMPGGNMLSAAVQAAWPLQLAQWQLTPKIGALYQRQTLDGFSEALNSTNPDASSFPVDGKRSRYNALQPYAAMAIEHSFVAHGVTYVPEVSLGYRYNTHNTATPIVQVTAQDGTVFDLPGTAQGRGMGTAGARITAQAGASWSLYADYQGFFGSRLHDNALSFGFTKRF
ncbi:autotransporter-associated beta strand repeat-containing protein [Dyella acidisoli]|uniref:autotransporter-associated beta strand repeat-containing protein n=1 Tax=Dyella acidisoli TaxID=1867834 RepID=UPI003C2B78C8